MLNPDGSLKNSRRNCINDGTFGSLTSAGSGFGQSVAALGDIDGDDIPDIAIGAPGGNELYYVTLNIDGSIKTVTEIDVSSLALENGASFTGRGMGLLGDLNEDGFDDILVGAYNEDSYGAAYVLFMGENFQVKDY